MLFLGHCAHSTSGAFELGLTGEKWCFQHLNLVMSLKSRMTGSLGVTCQYCFLEDS